MGFRLQEPMKHLRLLCAIELWFGSKDILMKSRKLFILLCVLTTFGCKSRQQIHIGGFEGVWVLSARSDAIDEERWTDTDLSSMKVFGAMVPIGSYNRQTWGHAWYRKAHLR